MVPTCQSRPGYARSRREPCLEWLRNCFYSFVRRGCQTGQADTVTTVQVLSQTQNTTVNLSTSDSNDWVLVGAFTEYSDQTISANNATSRVSLYSGVYGTWDTNGPLGSTSFSSTLSTSPYGRRWFVSMISIKPAPITPDAFDSTESVGTATSVIKSFTVGSGSNRALYVFVRTNNVAVSSITYNGTALSAISDSLIDNGTYGHRLQWFQLASPDPGTHDLVVNLASSGYATVFIHSYAGVAQTGQADTVTTVQVLSQTQNTTVNLSTSDSNDWVLVGAFTEYSDQTISANNATSRVSLHSGVYGTWDTNGPLGSTSFSSTLSTSPYGRRWFVSMISLKN